MTELLMMTLTAQLRKIAIKKRVSHPSSIRELDLDFRKLVDKLEQAEITMKLEETENLKLQYVNRIETNTTHINNIQDSDVDLIEKITEIMITSENDYEPITYEQPFTSHIYENLLEFFQNFYTRPISNNVPVEQEVNETNTVIKPEKDEVQSSSTNHIYQKIQKKTAKRKSLDNSISLRKSKK